MAFQGGVVGRRMAGSRGRKCWQFAIAAGAGLPWEGRNEDRIVRTFVGLNGVGRGMRMALASAGVILVAGLMFLAWKPSRAVVASTPPAEQRGEAGLFHPTAAQWAALTVEPVQQVTFRSEFATEGRSRSMKIVRRGSTPNMAAG